MALLTREPQRHRAFPSSPTRPAPGPPDDRRRDTADGARLASESGGGAAEFVRLLVATLAFYAALIVAPLLLLVPLAMLGLALGLIGLLVGG